MFPCLIECALSIVSCAQGAFWDRNLIFGFRTYKNGDIYYGQLHNGLRRGLGTLLRHDGACYHGLHFLCLVSNVSSCINVVTT
jgi:hypothetical protein